MSQETARVTIIVPVYNAAAFLEDCLGSIARQSYSNIEVLVVDDGSTDSSRAIYERYSQSDHRFRAIYQKNRGVSSARNIGLKFASGQYVCFVDSDDHVGPNYIETLLRYMKKDVDLVASTFVERNNISNRLGKVTQFSQKNKFRILYQKRCYGVVFAKLFRIEIIRSNNLSFNENIFMCEDSLFVAQYLGASKKCAKYIDCGNYVYRLNLASSSRSICNAKWFTVFSALDHLCDLAVSFDKKSRYEFAYSVRKFCIEAHYRRKICGYNNRKCIPEEQRLCVKLKDNGINLNLVGALKTSAWSILKYYLSIRKCSHNKK